MVSIIIINYNTFQLTYNCISSVIAHTKAVAYEIILVDNASTECDATNFLAHFPQIKLIQNRNNSGFAKGNNLGIAEAKGELILLLNSDTYLTEDSIGKCWHYYNQQPNMGVLGVRMVYENGNIQHTARRFRSIWWELLDALRFILLLLPYRKRANLMLGKYFKADYNLTCDWVNGAFFIFSKNALSYLPNQRLDERFFMYGEDHLWCYQFSQLGLQSHFLADTTIVHINNGSTNKNKQVQLIRVMIANELVIMQERVGKGWYYLLFCCIFLTKEYARYATKWLLFRFSGKLIR